MLKKDVLDYYGSVSATAEALGITPQAVSMWPEVVPASRQWQIEVETAGRLKAYTSKPKPTLQSAP